MSAEAICRLPDPILIEAGRAYRYGLHLFDYTDYCPTEVELVLWARTDAGEVRSDRVRLSYLIGSGIPPLARYERLLQGPDEAEARRALQYGMDDEERREGTAALARRLWEEAGKPEGRDSEFWSRAESTLGRRAIIDGDLMGASVRPLT